MKKYMRYMLCFLFLIGALLTACNGSEDGLQKEDNRSSEGEKIEPVVDVAIGLKANEITFSSLEEFKSMVSSSKSRSASNIADITYFIPSLNDADHKITDIGYQIDDQAYYFIYGDSELGVNSITVYIEDYSGKSLREVTDYSEYRDVENGVIREAKYQIMDGQEYHISTATDTFGTVLQLHFLLDGRYRCDIFANFSNANPLENEESEVKTIQDILQSVNLTAVSGT